MRHWRCLSRRWWISPRRQSTAKPFRLRHRILDQENSREPCVFHVVHRIDNVQGIVKEGLITCLVDPVRNLVTFVFSFFREEITFDQCARRLPWLFPRVFFVPIHPNFHTIDQIFSDIPDTGAHATKEKILWRAGPLE